LESLSAEIEQAIFEAHQNQTHNEYRWASPQFKLTNRHCVRSRILNLKDKNNPLLAAGVLSREILPTEFAHMTSEDMASPQRRQENMRLRRNSLTQTVGVNDMKPVISPDENVPGEPGMDEMGRSGQLGLEYQRPV
jgi:Transcription factor S-II (TFIIS), central domain